LSEIIVRHDPNLSNHCCSTVAERLPIAASLLISEGLLVSTNYRVGVVEM